MSKKHNDLLFKQQFQRGFQRQHSAGVAQGAYAMCKVIHDKAIDTSKTAEERITWITNFCGKLLESATSGVKEASHNNEG
ncbi:MAG: hypothetical protein IJ418_16405 [Clostridia bacterium]|nr:hypothetical protein [Clostridia bacterium]